MNKFTTDLTKELMNEVDDVAAAFDGNAADLRCQADKLYNTANYLLVVAKNLELLACGSSPPPPSPRKRRSQAGNVDVQLANRAVSIYQCRRRRELIFGAEELFGEPGWDIMLDLFIGQVQQRATSVTSACIGSAVPATTALRWIGVLENLGLIVREVDPHDRRRVFLALSQQDYDKMVQCLGKIQ